MIRKYAIVAAAACAVSAPAFGDEIVTIPRGCNVTSITGTHQSERNAFVAFASTRNHRSFVNDGRTGELDNRTGNFSYAPKYSYLFAASRRPFRVRVGGQWSNGTWLGWVKSTRYSNSQTVRPYPDRVEVDLFTGANDNDWNTQIVLHLGGRCR